MRKRKPEIPEKLKEVLRHVARQPRRLWMRWYFTALPGVDELDGFSPWPKPACGTVACLAGWAVALNRSPSTVRRINNEGRESEVAATILGISDDEAQRLFAPEELTHSCEQDPHAHYRAVRDHVMSGAWRDDAQAVP